MNSHKFDETRRRTFIRTSVVAIALLVAVAGLVGSVESEETGGGVLEKVERRIGKEPVYSEAPKYLLLAFGGKAETKVWVVEDGKTLYVDRNANGDLTDDGDAVRPTGVREIGRTPEGKARWDFEYVVDAIRPVGGGAEQTKLVMRRWNYGEPVDGYGLSVDVKGVTPMYAGWTWFWETSAEKAQVIHFGGRLRPRLLRLEDGALTYNSKRLSVTFETPGVGKGSAARLSIDAPLAAVVPVVKINWPVAEGAEPLTTTHRLRERCCYWEFYDSGFKVPAGAVTGTAVVTVTVPAGGLPYEVVTERVEVAVTVRN